MRLKIGKILQFNEFRFFLSRLGVLLIFLYLWVKSLNVKFNLDLKFPLLAPRCRSLFVLGKFSSRDVFAQESI